MAYLHHSRPDARRQPNQNQFIPYVLAVLNEYTGSNLADPGRLRCAAEDAISVVGELRRRCSEAAAEVGTPTEKPFLHAVATNANAIRLYQAPGFELRRTTAITVLERS